MNLYIRYFYTETLVHSVEEAVDFLKTLDLPYAIDDNFVNDLRSYIESNVSYPKRYKVNQNAYFIVIKTKVQTIDEFKQNGLKGGDCDERQKDQKTFSPINQELPGWYDATLLFKRVVPIPETNKFQYIDTNFRVQCKAMSPSDCYNRIVDYLRHRSDIDVRSQFPSVKGRNFSYEYLGEDFKPAIG